MQIENCLKTIESLKSLLKIVGTGALGMISLYFFFKEEFSQIIAQSLLASTGMIIIFILFLIFKRYAIIQQLNLGDEHD